MARLLAAAFVAALVLAVVLANRRLRQRDEWTVPRSWRADWEDPAMDVYDYPEMLPV